MQKIASALKFLRSAVPIASRHQHYPICSRGLLVPACRKTGFARESSSCKSLPWEHWISDHTYGSKAFARLLTCQDRKRGRDIPSWRLSAAKKGQIWQKGKSQTRLEEHFSASPLLTGFCGSVTRSCFFWKKEGDFGSLADFIFLGSIYSKRENWNYSVNSPYILAAVT